MCKSRSREPAAKDEQGLISKKAHVLKAHAKAAAAKSKAAAAKAAPKPKAKAKAQADKRGATDYGKAKKAPS